MVELYFFLYRIPKMMTRAARERGRSALAWSLLGIGVWIGAEVVAATAIGVLYGILGLVLDWEHGVPIILRVLGYFLSLAAGLVSVTLLRRYLLSTPRQYSYSLPPPPPTF